MEEMRSAMNKLLGQHMSHREIDAVLREADNNGDGSVDFEGNNGNSATISNKESRHSRAVLSSGSQLV